MPTSGLTKRLLQEAPERARPRRVSPAAMKGCRCARESLTSRPSSRIYSPTFKTAAFRIGPKRKPSPDLRLRRARGQTDADQRRLGHFDAHKDGTVALGDENDESYAAMKARMTRVTQEEASRTRQLRRQPNNSWQAQGNDDSHALKARAMPLQPGHEPAQTCDLRNEQAEPLRNGGTAFTYQRSKDLWPVEKTRSTSSSRTPRSTPRGTSQARDTEDGSQELPRGKWRETNEPITYVVLKSMQPRSSVRRIIACWARRLDPT